MTASPVWNTRNPHVSIAQLESNMDAKVVGIHNNINELEEKSPKPEEVSFVNGVRSFITDLKFSVSRVILIRQFLMTVR
jgi:hypothetical protein